MNTARIGQWYVEKMPDGRGGLVACRERNSVKVEQADKSDAPGEFHVTFHRDAFSEERFPEQAWREMLVVAGELLARVSTGSEGGRS